MLDIILRFYSEKQLGSEFIDDFLKARVTADTLPLHLNLFASAAGHDRYLIFDVI